MYGAVSLRRVLFGLQVQFTNMDYLNPNMDK